MLGWILLAFVALPFLELWLLLEIQAWIGWPRTLGLVFGTGLLGALLARWQGAQAWRDVISAAREGRAPKRELGAGALFLFGAALLLTPGVITDAVGFSLMVPWVRRALAGWLIARIRASDRVQTYASGDLAGGLGGLGGPGGARRDYDVDVEGYTKEEDGSGDEGAGGPPPVE